jgi:serine/threonine protein phosphatase 1
MDFGRIIVHGHTPVEEWRILPNRIDIDSRAFATGRLTCVVLGTGSGLSLKTAAEKRAHEAPYKCSLTVN